MPGTSDWLCSMPRMAEAGGSAPPGRFEMRRRRGAFTTILATALLALPLQAEQLSEGQPHKWEAVANKSMYDFVADGFELKAVAYDTSVMGPQSDMPDVHYFLQKGAELVRCDFRKRAETSYYWCYQLAKVNRQ